MNYKDKYFSILGDSISTLEGYSEPRDAEYYDITHKHASGVFLASDTWWGKVIDKLGGALLVNNAISGSTVCRHPLYEVPSYACSEERTSSLDRNGVLPDVIMTYIGTNDWGCGVRIYHNERSSDTMDDLSFFLPAYGTMLERLKRNYPNAEIWCFTLPISKWSTNKSFAFPYSYGGRHISEYCDAIKACADQFGCRLIDLYRDSEPYDTVDGFHPTVDGMQTIAESVLRELNSESGNDA